MNANFLSLLACPNCSGALRTAGSRGAEAERSSLECTQGCGCYPIAGGVPRLLPELADTASTASEHQAPTRSAFSAQWRLHKGETTWGVTVEERVPIVLHELGWDGDDLAGKTILDAGCGNGTLSRALADRGATVVALDLSESVFDAHRRLNHPRLLFVQGNLFFPPLAAGAFDAIYSCGVFHHTPSTQRCFDMLAPTLKPGAESRYFVWLYAKRSRLFGATVEQIMKVTRRLPSWALVPACHALAAPVEASSRICTRLGLAEDAPRSLRDRAVQLHDLLSPPFVWYHDFDEASAWARQQGFERIERTRYGAGGEGAVGPILEKYRKICRPGFGILCRRTREAEAVRA